MKKIDTFIVTKPLQYINALNIDSENEKIILLINSFTGASSFFKQIERKSKYWSEQYFFESVDVALDWVLQHKSNINTLFIDNDRKFQNDSRGRLLKDLNLTVYEEGIGTYIKNIYKPRRKIVGNLFLLFQSIKGNKNKLGGYKHTKNIIVYYPEFYLKYTGKSNKNILKFKDPFLYHIQNCKELDVFHFSVDFTDLIDKTVVLYLPSWKIDFNDINKLDELKFDKLIIKPHPHTDATPSNINFDLKIPAETPAELMILELIKKVKKLIIISNYSSTTLYFSGIKKVLIINTISRIQNIHINYKIFIDTFSKLQKHIETISTL